MKATLAIILMLAAVMCLIAMQTPPNKDIITLRGQIADLSLRVSRLEHAAGTIPGAVDKSHADTSVDNVPRSMIVAGMNTMEPRAGDPDEVDGLKQDAESFQQTARFHRDNQDRISGSYYAYGSYSDGHYGYDHSYHGRQRAEVAQRQMANRYATEAMIKRKKAKQLEDAATQPLQVINGHDGDVVFSLRASQDLSRALVDISIGDTVTWSGRRISADHTSEVWEITSIRKLH